MISVIDIDCRDTLSISFLLGIALVEMTALMRFRTSRMDASVEEDKDSDSIAMRSTLAIQECFVETSRICNLLIVERSRR